MLQQQKAQGSDVISVLLRGSDSLRKQVMLKEQELPRNSAVN